MTKLAELQAALTSKRVELEQMQDTLASMETDPLAHFEDEVTSAWDDYLNEAYGEQVEALPWCCGSAAELWVLLKKKPPFDKGGTDCR